MYNIRQFKPSLYVLLILGTLGFALASQSEATAVLGVVGILCNGWLVLAGRFKPIPRLVANIVTLGSTAYVANRVVLSGTTPVLVIGQFLVLLQLIKLWEQRANRDYAQLLVLSLLLMVAAAISTASLLFGVILIGYLFLSLYCCLLFHLKVETDAARAALALPEDKVSPETLRQDQRYLSSSMRRLTGFVSTVAVSMAVIVFLFFPRGTGAGVLGPVNFQAGQPLTGFSDQVGFQKIAQIQQNPEVVAYMKLWHNGQLVRGDRTILLRGTTLDYYTGEGGAGAGAWLWQRASRRVITQTVATGQVLQLFENETPKDEWRQQIQFRRPLGTETLFAMEGLVSFRPRGELDVRVSRYDDVIQAPRAKDRALEYEVVSRGTLDPPPGLTRLSPPPSPYGLRGYAPGGDGGFDRGPNPGFETGADQGVDGAANVGPDGGADQGIDRASERGRWRDGWGRRGERGRGLRRAPVNPKIESFARRAEVSGSDAQGPLAARRASDQATTPVDEQIALNIERYLRQNFTYTLDLTDARTSVEGQDPLVAFLYDLKRGHCEYFAGAMTLLCQSLGMEARLVTGFKCDEFNEFNDQYVIRQAHAHAWVEVRTAAGWRTFDPTSGRETVQSTTTGSLWQKAKHLFNYMEFQYGNAVIAYDNENQENLVHDMETGMTRTAWRGAEAVRKLRDWLDSNKTFWIFSSNALLALVALLSLMPLGMIVYVLIQRARLHRRASRIGLESLPASLQRRLVRQLGFYDALVLLLARHGIHRPAHLTPLEFSQSLGFLPAAAYDTINRLTELFYRVRFGQAELTAGQRRHVNVAGGDVAAALGAGRGVNH
jgi:hypothetical protein